MDELAHLRSELIDLRRELSALKRRRWLTPTSVGIVLIAIAALAVAAPKQDHTPTQLAQTLNVKVLKVVDDAGKTMLQIGSDKDGGYLVINGADAKKRFFTAIENNSGFSDWYDAAGNRRATVFIGAKDNAELRLSDKTEQPSAVLQQADFGGFMTLNGPGSGPRVAAGEDKNGGYFDLYDAAGARRLTSYFDDQSTMLFRLQGGDQAPQFSISGSPAGGIATAYGSDGKAKATLPATP